MEISVLNKNFIVDGITIPINSISEFTAKVSREIYNVTYGQHPRIIELDYTTITSPVFATFVDLGVWLQANLKNVTDISELTDTTGIIPTESTDLTDSADLSRAYIGTPLNAYHAEVTFEFDGSGTSVVAGNIVIINGKVYTYVDALSVLPTEGEVLIGADDTSAMANLYMAINDIGISYGLTHWCTVNADVTFKDYHGSNGMTIEAILGGLAGNSITVSTDVPNAQWQDSTHVLTATLVDGASGTIGNKGDRYFPPSDPAHNWVAIADNGLNDENWILVDIQYENCIVSDYATMGILKTASQLEPYKYYLMYDHACSYNIFDGGTMNIEEEKIGVNEPLLLFAISTSQFDKVAISPLRPNDIIHYSFDILDIRDIGYGNGVDTVNANFKGQIYYRKDTIQNNECHYNFVPNYGVTFRRWAVDATEYAAATAYVAKDVCKSSDGKIYKCITATTGEGDPTVNTADWVLWLDITADAFVSWTSDKTKFNISDITTDNLIINNVTAGVDYDDFATFGDYYNWVNDVHIGNINFQSLIDDGITPSILLSQKVFKTTDSQFTCKNNYFGSDTFPMTFGDQSRNLTICNNTSKIIFGTSNGNIVINENCTEILLGSGNSAIKFYDVCSRILLYNSNTNIIFEYNNYNITLGSGNNLLIFKSNSCGTNNILIGDLVKLCSFESSSLLAIELDLRNATHIRGDYNTTIYQDKTLGVRLSYLDNDVLTYAAVTA